MLRQLKKRFPLNLLFLVGVFMQTPASAGDVTLSWDPVNDEDIVGYTLYYGRSSGNYMESAILDKQTYLYTVQGLDENATYYFVVTAENEWGMESEHSNEVAYYVPQEGSPAPSDSEIQTATIGVSAPNDDAESWNYGAINWDYVVIRVGSQGSATWIDGLRFPDVPIPRGATILSAYLSLAPWTTGLMDFHTVIYGLDEESTLPFDCGEYMWNRPYTLASADWIVNNIVAKRNYIGGASEQFPNNVSHIVQEIVNNPGWSQGNALGFIIEAASPYDSHNGSYANFGTFESGYGAKLYVTYK